MKNTQGKELLSTKEIYFCDDYTIKNEIPSNMLMENAGFAVACEIAKKYKKQEIYIMCGSGNNGGDGFVIARALKKMGFFVKTALLGKLENLKGDAKINADKWQNLYEQKIYNLDIEFAKKAKAKKALIVDAILGAGLSKPVAGTILQIINYINKNGLTTVAVDVPTGVNGDDGKILRAAPKCELTVSFFRKKIGHCLYPAKEYCGELVIKDIGIPNKALDFLDIKTFENNKNLFSLPKRTWDKNKYDFGHLLVYGKTKYTGAVRLATNSARKVGAGLATIACDEQNYNIYSNDSSGHMVEKIKTDDKFIKLLEDKRKNVCLVGCGATDDEELKNLILGLLEKKQNLIIDAGGVSCFKDAPKEFVEKTKQNVVITPHEGEFRRLFPEIYKKGISNLEKAKLAAQKANCIVVLKGASTIIANRNNEAVINHSSAYNLATGGTGDVLSGIIAGFACQNNNLFDSACLGVLFHSQLAKKCSKKMIAEELLDKMSGFLSDFSTN